jgi:Xaa-Pro aminopeptidase
MAVEADSDNLARVINALVSYELDALVCSLPSHVLLLTGYEPVIGNAVAVFTQRGGVHLLVPEDEAEMAAETSYANQLTFRPRSLNAITDSNQSVALPLLQLLKKLGLEHSQLGLEMYGLQHPASYLSQHRYGDSLQSLIADEFRSIRLLSADQLLQRLCAVKTKPQIDGLRISCDLAGMAFKQAARSWKIGMTEPEVANVFQSAYGRITAERNISRTQAQFFCMSGENAGKANAAFAMTRQRVIRQGDTVLIHCNSNVNGYWTGITRTYIRGERSLKHRQMVDAIADARSAALDAIAPGVAASEVDMAARTLLTNRGFGDLYTHATGHGVGFGPANSNAFPRIHPKSPDVLEAGMTFTLQPAIYLGDLGGMRHCDVVAVTGTGVDILTDFQSPETDR